MPSIAPLPTIAVVGSGPTALYTLSALQKARTPLDITVFEALDEAGRGSPYAPSINNKVMLSNIASIEIPPVLDTMVGWLETRTDKELAAIGLERSEIDEREYYPRLILGTYLKAQFDGLITALQADGHTVRVETGARVTDAALLFEKIRLTVERTDGAASSRLFDHAVLATGHSWPDRTEIKPGYFTSPWPASALNGIRNCSLGIRGTSLSAIDALMTVATNHGAFVEQDGGGLRYEPEPGTEGFKATIMSRKGLIPEADFFYHLPFHPLSICTEEAMEALVESGRTDLLEAVYELFARELARADPDYAARIGLEELNVDTFAEAYFAERQRQDPFDYARANLAEAKGNAANHYAVPWRYAILRMHEVIALVVPHFSVADLERFHRSFKAIFVDDYASVPHESIERLLALHEAGKLSILKLGEDYDLDAEGPEPGAVLMLDGKLIHYPAFVEARGQESLSADDIPFPTLLRQGVVRKSAGGRGIALDDSYRLSFTRPLRREIYCLSLPFLLYRHPFAQGITSSHELGECVGAAILETIEKSVRADVAASEREELAA
ncbi:FAD/NAD(P)-binding protein [Mesorhizobium sp. RP14(2022)]|uniref:FAD/NAD(P)-binding protein n=1 Tax=Mesorhizobium liriopis TaxID=2953882 RepID=A0ABT1CAS8_9HYPH|nr:FAD/NAD(P)-binding protein [Mesorhizobium liriopis]MCO6051924.1 FAD/NAD(P)-binding protein [Mesorhizobium liriopis]